MEIITTLQTLLNNSFQTYELEWLGTGGWTTGAGNAALEKELCGSSLVMKWVDANKAAQSGPFCAAGNSFGSVQISYSLAVYNMSDTLDMVLLTAGPESRIDVSCFGTNDSSLQSSVWIGSQYASERKVFDIFMAWKNNGNYCSNGFAPEEIFKLAQDNSLTSPTEYRQYDYPNTKVNFIVSPEDPKLAYPQSQIYYNLITSAKAYYTIAEPVHAVPETPDGYEKIRQLMLDECKVQN